MDRSLRELDKRPANRDVRGLCRTRVACAWHSTGALQDRAYWRSRRIRAGVSRLGRSATFGCSCCVGPEVCGRTNRSCESRTSLRHRASIRIGRPRLNILHVIRDLSRSTGGPVNALVGLAEAQAALGHRVMILATDRGEDQMTPQGVATELVPADGGGWSWSPRFGSELADLVPGIDIVHGHMVWDYPVWAAARQARRHGKPFILPPCGHLDAWSLSPD